MWPFKSKIVQKADLIPAKEEKLLYGHNLDKDWHYLGYTRRGDGAEFVDIHFFVSQTDYKIRDYRVIGRSYLVDLFNRYSSYKTWLDLWKACENTNGCLYNLVATYISPWLIDYMNTQGFMWDTETEWWINGSTPKISPKVSKVKSVDNSVITVDFSSKKT